MDKRKKKKMHFGLYILYIYKYIKIKNLSIPT